MTAANLMPLSPPTPGLPPVCLPAVHPTSEPHDQTGISWELYLAPALANSKGLFDPEITVGFADLAEVPEIHALLAEEPDDEVETTRLPLVARRCPTALGEADDDPTTPWRMPAPKRARPRRTSRRAKLSYLASAAGVVSLAVILAGFPPSLARGPDQYQASEVQTDLGWIEARLSDAVAAELDPAVGLGALELGRGDTHRVAYSVATR